MKGKFHFITENIGIVAKSLLQITSDNCFWPCMYGCY